MAAGSRRSRRFTAVVMLVAIAVGASCGGSNVGSAPTSPSPSPTPTPAPTPAPPPMPAPVPAVLLLSVSIDPATVTSQNDATGMVTLSDVAPAGGVVVALSSSSSAARLPDTVTVPAGASSVSFPITTAATDLEQTSTVSASYSGVIVSTTLVITRRPLTVLLTVTSSTRGADACALKDSGATFDCSLDASASRPSSIIHTYFWTNTISGHGQTHSQSHNSTESISRPDAGCSFAFISGIDPQADGSGGYFVPMTITLYVETTTRERSATLTRTVRVYPNRLCNYDF